MLRRGLEGNVPLSPAGRCADPSTQPHHICVSTAHSPTAALPSPRPGTVSFRTVPSAASAAISLSTAVGAPRKACTCATVAIGGRSCLEVRTWAMRVEFMPGARSGSSSNMEVRMCARHCGMLRVGLAAAKEVTEAVSGRRGSERLPCDFEEDFLRDVEVLRGG